MINIEHQIADIRPRLVELDRLEAERRQQTIELQKALEQANAVLTSAAVDVVAKEAKAETEIATLEHQVDKIDREFQQAARARAEAQDRFEIRVAAIPRGAGSDVAALLSVQAAPLLRGCPLASRRSGEALPEVVRGREGAKRVEEPQEATQGRLHE